MHEKYSFLSFLIRIKCKSRVVGGNKAEWNLCTFKSFFILLFLSFLQFVSKKKGFKCQTIHFIYFFIVIICKNFYKHFIKYICQKFLVIYVFAVSACVSLYSVFRCRFVAARKKKLNRIINGFVKNKKNFMFIIIVT